MARQQQDERKESPSVERRVQGYMPPEMHEQFTDDAKDHGGPSSFIRYLYRRYKREEAAKADQQNKAA